MIAPRRFLPSIPSLLALEAVERLGSATAAAEDLSLTHSAVSRQLKVLEEQLGVRLFLRAGKGLALTPAGVDYARAVRETLQDLARAGLRIRAGGARSSLNLAVLPAFGMHWLTPRLKGFDTAHPGVILNIGTRVAPFDFNHEGFDAAVHFGARDWPGVVYLELARERVIPAACPGLAGAGPLAAEAIRALPLLHLESRPGAWEAWFEAQGCAAQALRGMVFDQFAPLAEAAAHGFGVALLPACVAEAEFARGRLVPLVAGYTAVEGSYYLVWPQMRPQGAGLRALIGWLEAARDPL
jgi:LysR family transcriptional regulator, glycine cleavage system transcriptional activator